MEDRFFSLEFHSSNLKEGVMNNGTESWLITSALHIELEVL